MVTFNSKSRVNDFKDEVKKKLRNQSSVDLTSIANEFTY